MYFDSKYMEIYTIFDLNQNEIPWLSLTIHHTLNKKLVKVSHMDIKGGSSLVNHLVD